MPYPPDHLDRTRLRIIRAAQKLFNRHGFDGVSIDEIMAEADLTRGGFYRHFASKSDLYAEVMDCFFTNPACGNNWEGVQVDPDRGPLGPQIVRAYLSPQHFHDIDHSCPMVALPGDIARSGENAKRAYENALRAMVAHLQSGGGPEREQALAIAALCIGGMVLARATEDVGLADEVREAAMGAAWDLGGWERLAPPRRAPAGARDENRHP